MTLSLSFLSSGNPILSFLVRLDLGTLAFLSSTLMSALSTMASSSLSLEHKASTAVMYSTLGMYLGAKEKLGPFAEAAFCPSVKLILERLMTYLLMLLLGN